ncbi:MAG: ATP-dependent Clp protease adaptor ClpS [Bacteroidales bacterium]|nr:ATP-dependent Clp protease adaptor ClpS [Bacteroidales bacterium]
MNKKSDFDENNDVKKASQKGKNCSLILHNDDIHDFEYVINSLVDICKHEPIQAEQCTYLVHYRGSCSIKKGHYIRLKPMYDKLVERELTVSFD